MWTLGPGGEMKWYMPGQGQLGLEGLTVGVMYVAFALCCTGLVILPKHIGGQAWSRVLLYGLLFGACFLFERIVHFYKWKTGYRWRFYLLDWCAILSHIFVARHLLDCCDGVHPAIGCFAADVAGAQLGMPETRYPCGAVHSPEQSCSAKLCQLCG
jgi:OST3 / OST6 family, transporter family